MSSSKFLLSICCLLLLAATGCKSTRFINKTYKSIPVFEKGFTGFIIYDPEKKLTLFENNADKYFTPASNTKLFTFYAGLKMLGDSVPALKYQIKNDSLIFTGTGDPSFLNPNLPSSDIYDYLRNSKEKLYYVLPEYTETAFGSGWSWNWYAAYYAAERTNFPIYGNTVSFQFLKGTEKPLVYPKIFTDSLSISQTYLSSRMDRKKNRNIFIYNNPEKEKEFIQNIPMTYSPNLMVELLNDTLKKNVVLLKNTPNKYNLNSTLYSVPTDSVLKRMMVVSDNFVAEQILLMAAGEHSDSLKTRSAINFMKENYLQDLPDEPMWYDGSGLSSYNKFTPRSIIKLLQKIQQEVPQEKLMEMLPIGGVSGTIRNNYKADTPYIFAKTGTLSNVVALSGFLKTKRGKILLFSFLHNNHVVPSYKIKDGMEKILIEVRDKY